MRRYQELLVFAAWVLAALFILAVLMLDGGF